MILRRLIDNLRSQNWTGLTLELLVLVVGVFLGLQVDDWNEGRKDRALEQAYLERLWNELEGNAEILEESVEGYQSRLDHIHDVIRYVHNPTPDPEWNARISARRLGGFVLPALNLSFATYEELIATGALTLITSEELRAALQANKAMANSIEGQLEYFRGFVASQYTGDFHDPFVIGYYVNENGGQTPLRDFEHLRGHLDFMSTLDMQEGTQFRFVRYRGGELQLTRDALRLLACELGRPECDQEQEASQ